MICGWKPNIIICMMFSRICLSWHYLCRHQHTIFYSSYRLKITKKLKYHFSNKSNYYYKKTFVTVQFSLKFYIYTSLLDEKFPIQMPISNHGDAIRNDWWSFMFVDICTCLELWNSDIRKSWLIVFGLNIRFPFTYMGKVGYSC